jgi:hypothetical protein
MVSLKKLRNLKNIFKKVGTYLNNNDRHFNSFPGIGK